MWMSRIGRFVLKMGSDLVYEIRDVDPEDTVQVLTVASIVLALLWFCAFCITNLREMKHNPWQDNLKLADLICIGLLVIFCLFKFTQCHVSPYVKGTWANVKAEENQESYLRASSNPEGE